MDIQSLGRKTVRAEECGRFFRNHFCLPHVQPVVGSSADTCPPLTDFRMFHFDTWQLCVRVCRAPFFLFNMKSAARRGRGVCWTSFFSQPLHLLDLLMGHLRMNPSPSLFCNLPFSSPITFQNRRNVPCTVSSILDRTTSNSVTEGDASLEETLEEGLLAEENLVEIQVKAEQ
ncbi:hypothetical protein LR48_Vigan06g093800 [Vigna angularis]|uniref:Uncharacterized protein n=1 Tax=Phaseolus angularis TaxID=3914 RepID=A0A0L9UST2_PHAAN|nr:hypothetical protein LR48_Vigan06g093800 [Vigna angularis]